MDRDKVKKEISKIMDKKLASKVEKSIYEFAVEYSNSQGTPFLLDNIYEEKADNIKENLKKEKLLEAIKSGTIPAEKIALLKPNELDPEKYEKINNKKQIEEKNKERETTTLYKCSKCKKRKCVTEEKQTRAADEPATIFVECLECGNKWRAN